ncbi:MAG: hypothetical protein ABSG67_15825 [Thermoguttaceae bacterium]|jgi:hypothetical protein
MEETQQLMAAVLDTWLNWEVKQGKDRQNVIAAMQAALSKLAEPGPKKTDKTSDCQEVISGLNIPCAYPSKPIPPLGKAW